MGNGMCPRCTVRPKHRALTGKKTEHTYCYECLVEYAREREALRSPRDRSAAQRNTWLMTTYGITQERYKEILERQGGGCAICGKKDHGSGKTALHVDHDHASGIIRGILCSGCNRGMGYFDRGFFKQAKKYIKSI